MGDSSIDHGVLQSIGYNLILKKFKKGQVILREGQDLAEVMIIISGSVDLTFKTTLVETVVFDSLFPGSTYAAWALFADGDAAESKSKFNVIGRTEGQYFSLAFSCLLRIAAVN